MYFSLVGTGKDKACIKEHVYNIVVDDPIQSRQKYEESKEFVSVRKTYGYF